MENSTQVLYVDDDTESVEKISQLLNKKDPSPEEDEEEKNDGNRVNLVTVDSGKEAVEKLNKRDFDWIVSEYKLPDMDGFELLNEVRGKKGENGESGSFILFTSNGNERVASKAFSKGVDDYYTKENFENLIGKITDKESDESKSGSENVVEEHERKRSSEDGRDEEILGSVEQYRTIVESVQDIVYVLDIDGEIRYVNDSMEEITGIPPEELIGKPATEFIVKGVIDEELFTGLRNDIRDLIRGETDELRTETEVNTESVQGKVAEISHSRLESDGWTEGVIGIARDITERKEAERELKRYQKLVETVGDSMYFLDEEGYITMVNNAFVEHTGYPREELVGSHVLEYMRPEDVEKGRQVIMELMNNDDKEWGRFEFVGEDGDGNVGYYEDNLAVLTDEEGDFMGTVGVIRDITKRKEQEKALERQKEELIRQRDRLEEFASMVSHDLRNPLNVAKGNLEMAQETGRREDFETALDAMERMEELMEDLLTLAREGREIGEKEKVELSDIVNEAWSNVDTVNAEIEVLELGVVRSDPDRLKEMFENLFRNAIEHGGVDVSVEVGGLEGEKEGFYIEDDGPGISEEETDQIFEHGYSTRERGTGFGLSIVENIVEAHGWEISIENGETDGARFEIKNVEFV